MVTNENNMLNQTSVSMEIKAINLSDLLLYRSTVDKGSSLLLGKIVWH